MSRCSRGSIAGRERKPWERGGRWEGGRGCRTIRSRTSTSVGRRGPRCVCFVSFVRVVVHISQQTLKITDRVSVIRPHNRKGLTFVGQDAVGGQRPRHGILNALEEALHFPSCPYTIFFGSNLCVDEGGILRRDSSGLYRLQPVLVCCVRATIESICGPQRNCRYNGPLTGRRRPAGRDATTFCRTQTITRRARVQWRRRRNRTWRPRFHAFLAVVPLHGNNILLCCQIIHSFFERRKNV